MEGIQFNIWGVIILLGAVQGFFLSVYFLVKKGNRTANQWLTFLLISVSLHLLEYAADITGITLQYPFFIAVTYPLLFLWGPFYYFYCRKRLDLSFKPGYQLFFHLLPALLILLLMIPFYTLDPAAKLDSLRKLSSGNQLIIPAEQLVFMGFHVLQLVTYILAAKKFVGRKQTELKAFSSDVHAAKKLDWLNRFHNFFSIYLVLYCLLVVLLSLIKNYQVQFDYVLLFITSASMYAIGYSAISNPEIFITAPNAAPMPINTDQPVAGNGMADREKNAALKEKLLQLMANGKPYLKSDLRISELADLLKVPVYQLSQLINDEFRMNFFDFVNRYRVEDAKKLFAAGNDQYKILSIGYEVGFNSKATFNRVFKKFTGFTPSDYKIKFGVREDHRSSH
jgi:AraC-like DNA-binding protein